MKRPLILIAYCALLAGLAFFALRTPKLDTWDILAYAANAEARHNNDFIHLHRYAYSQLQLHTPAANFINLTESSPYRRKTASDPVLFGTVLQFYSIRPLYVMLLSLGTALGVNPLLSAGLIAALSFFVDGLIAFLWMRAHTSEWIAFASSLLLMLSYPVSLVGRLDTPDALAACAMFCAAYLIFERSRLLPGLVLLLAAVFIRTDTCVFAGFTLLFLTRASNLRIRLRPAYALVLICLTATSVLAIDHFAGNYGYASLMHNQFVNEADPPDARYSVSAALYLRALASGVGAPAVMHGYTFTFLLIGLLAFIRERTPMRDLGFIALLTALAHFALFPYFHDRLFAGEYLLFAIAAVCTLGVPITRAFRPGQSDASGGDTRRLTLEISAARQKLSGHPRRA